MFAFKTFLRPTMEVVLSKTARRRGHQQRRLGRSPWSQNLVNSLSPYPLSLPLRSFLLSTFRSSRLPLISARSFPLSLFPRSGRAPDFKSKINVVEFEWLSCLLRPLCVFPLELFQYIYVLIPINVFLAIYAEYFRRPIGIAWRK